MHFKSANIFSLAIPGLVLLASPVAVTAEQEPIVVTATRIATPQSQVGSSVTVITAGEIARKQYKTVTQALSMVPGVDVVQSGGPGQQTSVFIRGASSSHTLVLIDGMNISDPSSPNGAVDFSSLLLDNIERIEVVRGPQSTLYGANAIGGVVNIITRKGEGPTKASLVMQLGNHSSNYQQLGLSGAQNRIDYSLTGTHLKTHADSVTPEDLRNGIAAEADRYRNNSLSTRLGYEFSNKVDVAFFGRYINDKRRTDPEVGFGTIEDEDAELKNREYFLKGEAGAVMLEGLLDSRFAVSYTDYNRRNNNLRSSPFETLQQTRFQGDTLEFSLNNNLYVAESHTLTVGGGTKKEEMNNDGISDFGGFFVTQDRSKASERTNYAYLQDQFSLMDRVFGTAGLRLDDRDDFGSELTYRFTGVYQHLETDTRLTGSLGTGFRAPSLFELYGFTTNSLGGAYSGNPDLEPEKSFGWELGVEQALMGDSVDVGFTYFKNDIDDLIETIFNFPDSTSVNVNNVDINGFETFFLVRLGNAFTLRADYTFTDTEVSDNSDRPLLRRPRKKASADVNYKLTGKTNVFVGVDYVGDRKDVDRTTGAIIDANDYTVFNGAVTYQLNSQFSLDARIDNILDKNYEPADGFEALGRHYMLGFSASL